MLNLAGLPGYLPLGHQIQAERRPAERRRSQWMPLSYKHDDRAQWIARLGVLGDLTRGPNGRLLGRTPGKEIFVSMRQAAAWTSRGSVTKGTPLIYAVRPASGRAAAVPSTPTAVLFSAVEVSQPCEPNRVCNILYMGNLSIFPPSFESIQVRVSCNGHPSSHTGSPIPARVHRATSPKVVQNQVGSHDRCYFSPFF